MDFKLHAVQSKKKAKDDPGADVVMDGVITLDTAIDGSSDAGKMSGKLKVAVKLTIEDNGKTYYVESTGNINNVETRTEE